MDETHHDSGSHLVLATFNTKLVLSSGLLNTVWIRISISINSSRSKAFVIQAEMEGRKIRRVLANRESTRQTIRRRQVCVRCIFWLFHADEGIYATVSPTKLYSVIEIGADVFQPICVATRNSMRFYTAVRHKDFYIVDKYVEFREVDSKNILDRVSSSKRRIFYSKCLDSPCWLVLINLEYLKPTTRYHKLDSYRILQVTYQRWFDVVSAGFPSSCVLGITQMFARSQRIMRRDSLFQLDLCTFGFSNRRLEQTATYSISTISE
ncbi:hypothetical protein Tco_0642508 [Tanacetum coccineum]